MKSELRESKGKSEGKAEGRQSGKEADYGYSHFLFPHSSLSLPCSSHSQVLDGLGETRYNRLMELVQLKSLFADLKQKASDLRGFL